VCLQDAPVIHRDGRMDTDFGGAHWKSKKMRRSRRCSGVRCSPVIGMHVVTELEEGIARHGFAGRESQLFCPLTDPVTGLGLILRVISLCDQMLVEIGRRSGSVLLWFGREHGYSG